MLNYIWLALIVIGISVAVWSDVNDIATNKYHNNEEDIVSVELSKATISLEPKVSYACSVYIKSSEIVPSSDTGIGRIIHRNEFGIRTQRAELIPTSNNEGYLRIFIDEKAPALWKNRFEQQKSTEFLTARIHWDTDSGSTISNARLKFDPVKFVKLNAVTNDGIIKYAKTAVELAIGLIGLMALWLGVMKIADRSGIVAKLAAILKPITTRIFPDVPADHPAMGAMIMNISANMLGLNNAATPLGLKAMEELEKLNKKVGTATDAMVTFLVINTSNVQIIPASVIAIRAAAGSSNPAEIIGAVIFASVLTMVIAIITVKLLAKLPGYRRQLTVTED